MNHRGVRLDPAQEALLARARVIRRLPDAVRERVLARARATVAARAAFAPTRAAAAPARSPWLRGALAAGMLLAIGAAGAAVALRGRAPYPVGSARAPRPLAVLSPPGVALSPLTAAPSSPTAAPSSPLAPQPTPIAKPQHPGPPAGVRDSYEAELDLLQRAQSAYAGRDFPSTLVLVAEHARRFPNGRLAEEREALRVRSLAGSGRTGEARRATDAFADRFPRSVLLPRLRETLGAGQ
jgi:hypothetical protein